MTKLIKPQQGEHLLTFLISMQNEVSEGVDNAESDVDRSRALVAHMVYSALVNLINPDVCVNEDQLEAVEGRIKAYVEALLSNEEFNPLKTPELISMVDAGKTSLVELVVLVNSFRLDCSRCLKKDCELRDPDYSL